MEIFKIIGIAFIGVIIIQLMREAKPEYSVIMTLVTGVTILIILINSLGSVIESFTEIVDKSGLSDGLFSGLLKIIGVGYITEYSASVCEDAGVKSLADKVQLGGKLTIFLMSLPILTSLIDVVGGLVQ